MQTCLALTSLLWLGNTDTVECEMASLDLAGRGISSLPQTGINSDFLFHRGGIGLGFVQGDLHGRVQVGHIQTGGTNSYIGIGGESNVYRIQMADIRYRPIDSVRLSAGIVEDFWVESGNRAWGFRNVEATTTEELGWMTRGNPGVSAVWSSSRMVMGASSHTGEGAYRRERNAGKNTSVYARIHLLSDERLYLEVYGQEGSYGFESNRNHRGGFRIASSSPSTVWRAGGSVLKAWGINGDATYTPLLVNVWGAIDPTASLRILGRLEQVHYQNQRTSLLLAGLATPIAPEGNLGVYWQSSFNDSDMVGIAGASASQQTHQIVVQLDGRFVVGQHH